MVQVAYLSTSRIIFAVGSQIHLPKSSGYFYADFVAEFVDGRILVIEYKGEHLKNSHNLRSVTSVFCAGNTVLDANYTCGQSKPIMI